MTHCPDGSPLARALSAARAEFAHNPAVIDVDGRHMTYGDLDGQVRDAVQQLGRSGVGPGCRVILLMPKSAGLLVWQLACIAADVIAVPLSPETTSTYVERVANSCAALALVGTDGRLTRLADPERLPPGPEHTAALMYTSGSTGDPKGVAVKHSSILNLALWGRSEFATTPDDVLAVLAPLHFAASTFDVFTGLLSGACLLLVPEQLILRPDQLLGLVVRSNVTVWSSVASVLMLLTRSPSFERDLEEWRSLRVLIFNGERMPIEVVRRVRSATRVRLCQFYGTTETNVCMFYDVPQSVPATMTTVPVGKPCAGHEVSLRETVDHRLGAIEVFGPGVMHGYWGAEPVGPGRGHVTGDLGSVDPDGNLVLHGRTDDIVKIRGRRVDLNAVEETVSAFEGVLAVAAFQRGEGIDGRLVLAVETENGQGAAQVMRLCADALPPHLRPDSVMVGPVPRTPRGKIDRKSLRFQPLDGSASKAGSSR